MDFIAHKQMGILLEAYQELDNSSPVFPFPEDAVRNTATMLSMPSVFDDLKERYGNPGEKDELLAQITAYRYYLIGKTISGEKGSDYVLFKIFSHKLAIQSLQLYA